MIGVLSQRIEFDRIVAVSAAVALNLAALAFLRTLNVQRPSEAPDTSNALQIVWIPRAAVVSNPRLPRSARSKSAQQRLRIAPSARETGPHLASRAVSVPSATEPPQAPLNLTLPSAAVELQRSPLERAAPLESAAPDRLRVTFLDRSLGGKLRRMAHASVCAEQRRALKAGGNVEPVLRSMQEAGCTP